MSLIDMTRRGLRAIARIRTLLASCEANFDETSTAATTPETANLD